MCGYFDDLNLSNGYESYVKDGFVTNQEVEAISEIHKLASEYIEPAHNQKVILADPNWKKVVKSARKAGSN
ncbi:MAG: hypothetical protein MUC94_04830 [bacterium]|nr:hypothetical protein [bacterium]